MTGRGLNTNSPGFQPAPLCPPPPAQPYSTVLVFPSVPLRGSIKEEISLQPPEHMGVKDRSHLRESDSEEEEEEKEEDHSSHEEDDEGSEEGGEGTHHGSLGQEDEEDKEEGHGLSLSQEEEEEEKEERREERAEVWVPLSQDHQEEEDEEEGLEEDELPFTVIPNPLARREVSAGASSEEEGGEDTDQQDTQECGNYQPGSLCGYCSFCNRCTECENCHCDEENMGEHCDQCQHYQFCYLCPLVCEIVCTLFWVITSGLELYIKLTLTLFEHSDNTVDP
ncbi:sarcoplasmic reticulum histidine-rich calcium-binding protein-like [Eschrichtius robustus]|uniref:sarcoplasmic reticulum histidine-rich calcium-binding protein-like n=1 Tax=Eschrichtius robustus TaxID=9764 RepID=UPI0035C26CBF